MSRFSVQIPLYAPSTVSREAPDIESFEGPSFDQFIFRRLTAVLSLGRPLTESEQRDVDRVAGLTGASHEMALTVYLSCKCNASDAVGAVVDLLQNNSKLELDNSEMDKSK